MQPLTNRDLHFVVSRLPKDVRDLMQKHGLFVAGGFIRSTIAGEKSSDIDLFGGENIDKLKLAAQEIALKRNGRIHETKNAITVLAPPRIPLQFITRWTYSTAVDLIRSFDYTIAQAVVWCDEFDTGETDEDGDAVMEPKWDSLCSEAFYPDLAARRLVYTSPQRNEDAGGSILRMRKFLSRGYNIQAGSMAAVIARLIHDLDLVSLEAGMPDEPQEVRITKFITGRLREVDPLRVIDGVDFLDEHEVVI